MAISTNQKPTIYRNLYEIAGDLYAYMLNMYMDIFSAGISHDPAGRSDDRACRLMNRQLSEGDKLQPISVGEYNDLKPPSVSEVNTGSYLNRVIR